MGGRYGPKAGDRESVWESCVTNKLSNSVCVCMYVCMHVYV